MAAIRFLLAAIAALLAMFLVAPVLILGFPFWAIALLTRLLWRLLEPQAMPWQRIIQFDPRLGWKPQNSLNVYCVGEPNGEVFKVVTDAHGWRGKNTITESKVIVFGDSFAFAYGVNENKSFSQYLPELAVKGIGAPGYNMVQELLLMIELSSQLAGKLVVWFIYSGNDLYDNLQPNLMSYRRPFVRTLNGTGNWEITTTHVSETRWPYNYDRHLRYLQETFANTYSETFISHRIYSACEFLIKESHEICRNAGAELVVVTVPDLFELSEDGIKRLRLTSTDRNSFDSDLPDKKISQICTKLGVHFVSAKSRLRSQDYSLGDRHWNERGNRCMAELLSDIYQNHAGARN